MDHITHLLAQVEDWKRKQEIPEQPVRIPREVFEDILCSADIFINRQLLSHSTGLEIVLWGIRFAPEVDH